MKRSALLVVAAALVLAACTATGSTSPTAPVPEFPAGVDWINTDRPLTLAELRGSAVLLDFSTYGCINCIHVLPDLAQLEDEFGDDLVVIGVHSAKFPNEAETVNIRRYAARYDIGHPMVNDADLEIWNAWGVRAWPTVILIAPDGSPVGKHEGEGVYDAVAPVLREVIAGARAAGTLAPVTVPRTRAARADTPLSFVAKVAVDDDGRLVIADTGHHRIVVADPADGRVVAVYGSGLPGWVDGAAAGAAFRHPHGVAVDGDRIYVADTGNHVIRVIESGSVETLAGTGELGWPPEAGSFDEVALDSPWDVVVDDGTLYVANAGTHQIWALDLRSRVAAPVAGSGREGTRNGPALEADLAQPSGLAFGDGVLYFADAESSSIRAVEGLDGPDPTVRLVAGSDRSLFDHGFRDGLEARFQHPLGVAWADGELLVADAYNHAIRAVDPVTGETRTLFGGVAGWRDGDEPLVAEPGGLAVDGTTLYVADTNNDVVRIVDLTTGIARTLVLRGLDAFPVAGDGGRSLTLPVVTAAAGPAEVVLDIALPEGYVVNADATSSLSWTTAPGIGFPAGATVDLTGVTFPLGVPVELEEGRRLLRGDLTVVYCAHGSEGLCSLDRITLEVPVDVGPAGTSSVIRIPYTVPPPGG